MAASIYITQTRRRRDGRSTSETRTEVVEGYIEEHPPGLLGEPSEGTGPQVKVLSISSHRPLLHAGHIFALISSSSSAGISYARTAITLGENLE